MKTADTFLRQHNAAWLGSYVRYDVAKVLLKLISQTSDRTAKESHIATFKHVVQEDLSSASWLADQLCEIANRNKQELVRVNSFLDERGAHNLDSISEGLKQTVLRDLLAQQHLVSAARSFNVCNFAAVASIWSKIAKNPLLSNDKEHALAFDGFESTQSAWQSSHRQLEAISAWNEALIRMLQLSLSLRQVAESETIAADLSAVGHSILQRAYDRLIVASKLGDERTVRALLTNGVDVNSTEFFTQRTALWYGCNNGHRSLVQYLLDSGANPAQCDVLGWTPQERAAYRGHVEIVKLFGPERLNRRKNAGSDLRESVPHPVQSSLDIDKHEASVVVNLGSLHEYNKHAILELMPPLSEASGQYTLHIYSSDGPGSKRVIQLPSLNDLTAVPFFFKTPNPDRTWLHVDLLKTSSDELLAAGSLPVWEAKPGSLLENVARDRRVALVAANDRHKIVGTLLLSVLVIKPFLSDTPKPKPVPWSFGHGIGGHRGSGQNKPNWKFLQIGENTLEALNDGAKHGAAYVEFDVQVTKDLVPVIYHDFLVSETGLDAPVHTLNFDQFSLISEAQSVPRSTPKPRSRSAGSTENPGLDLYMSQMKRTLEYRMNHFKPNTRGNFIHEPFTTLEECCLKLDSSIPFDIEIKYPMFFETEYWHMDPHFLEINLFVDTILEVLRKFAGTRSIFFSSFSPEICIALSLKQSDYPVFFLSDGVSPVGDSRAGSLQEALRFAKWWSLSGVVMESTAFFHCPRLVDCAKRVKLATASYGALNNDPGAVQKQLDAGLDGVIVDRVGFVQRHRRSRG